MPKFNMEKLKGFDVKDTENVKSEGKPYKVGAGLLNEVSKSQTKETKICYITRDEIEKNKKKMSGCTVPSQMSCMRRYSGG